MDAGGVSVGAKTVVFAPFSSPDTMGVYMYSVLLLDFIKKSHNVKRLPVKIFNLHLCSKYPTVSGLFLRLPDR